MKAAGSELLDREKLVREFDSAIDDLEAGLRECPDELWAASVWRVSAEDPWVWPKAGVKPIPQRTKESIQGLSAFWAVAYHCLFYLDFYVTTDMRSFQTPQIVRGGPEEQGMAADGAALIPLLPVYPREVLLEYLDYARRRVRQVVRNVADDALRVTCPQGHPHSGKTLRQLLEINLAHVRGHGGELLGFVRRQGPN